MKKLPELIYIAIENEGTDDQYFAATDTETDAIRDDGPTRVGTYRLVSSRKLIKVAKEKK